jgi:hypothetical protein
MGLLIILGVLVLMLAYCLQPYYAYKKDLLNKCAVERNGQKK